MKLPRLGDSWQGLGSSPLKPTKLVSHHEDYTAGETTGGLSVLFTVLCIVDLFGVFPVVTLPKSIIACGVYGIPLVLSVFALQMYTAILLGRSWLVAQEISPLIGEKNRRSPYAAVAELAFGPRARQLVTILIDATVFGAGVPNLLVASQSLQLFWWKITGGGVGISYCVWMLLIGLLLCPVMWLGSPKDMKPLALTSVFIVSTVAISTWTCILLDDVSPPSRGGVLTYQPSALDFLIAYGIIAFQSIGNFAILEQLSHIGDGCILYINYVCPVEQEDIYSAKTEIIIHLVAFDIHPMLLTIQVDMKNSRRINRAVFSGFFITGMMFAITTVLAAIRYGQDVDYNILQGIPPSISLYVVSLLVTLQLCLSSAVGNSALFQHVEDLLKISRDFSMQRCLLRSAIVALAVFLGEAVPRFDVVMGLVGSTLTGPLMFVFPPLFFLKLCYMKKYLIENDPDFPFKHNDLSITHEDAQNGGYRMSNVPRISNGTLANYNTFEDVSSETDDFRIKWYEVLLACTVMVMGIAATLVATYVSWSDAIKYATFTPPCLANVTAAARNFLEVSDKI